MTRRPAVRLFGVLLAAALSAASAMSQQPANTPPPPSPAASGAQPPAYSYDPAGRRDPFVSLIRRGTDPASRQGRAAPGIGGLLVGEIVLKGVMRSRGSFVALVHGPDGKTYLVRVGERMLDGSVRAISEDALIVMQDVNDPLSLTKQREVRLTLRPGGEPK